MDKLANVSGIGISLWGDLFQVVAAYEEMYEVTITFRFIGEDGAMWRGKGAVKIEAWDLGKGYSADRLADQVTIYEQCRGLPMDQIIYELLLRFQKRLQDVTGIYPDPQ